MSEGNQDSQNVISEEYIKSLEDRIASLEKSLTGLKNTSKRHENDVSYLLRSRPILPDTKLLSEKFVVRAFTVWGYYTTVSFILGIAGTIVGFVILFVQ